MLRCREEWCAYSAQLRLDGSLARGQPAEQTAGGRGRAARAGPALLPFAQSGPRRSRPALCADGARIRAGGGLLLVLPVHVYADVDVVVVVVVIVAIDAVILAAIGRAVLARARVAVALAAVDVATPGRGLVDLDGLLDDPVRGSLVGAWHRVGVAPHLLARCRERGRGKRCTAQRSRLGRGSGGSRAGSSTELLLLLLLLS